MAAMNVIYKKTNFKIYDAGDQYIVHNTNLDFHNHHTHINNFNTCKYIIDLCIHKTVPYHLSDYLLVSITRLSGDQQYINRIRSLISTNSKRKTYNKPQRQEYKNDKNKHFKSSSKPL